MNSPLPLAHADDRCRTCSSRGPRAGAEPGVAVVDEEAYRPLAVLQGPIALPRRPGDPGGGGVGGAVREVRAARAERGELEHEPCVHGEDAAGEQQLAMPGEERPPGDGASALRGRREAVPAQHRRQLDEQQGLMPDAAATSQQHAERPIGRGATRAVDAPPEDARLRGRGAFATTRVGLLRAIGERPHARGWGGCRRRREAPPERLGQAATDMGDAVAEVRGHPERAFPLWIARPGQDGPA
jgi:hypothetical protein